MDEQKSAGNTDHKYAANQAIAQLNTLSDVLDESINYAAQVTYAILPRDATMAKIDHSYDESTEQQVMARFSLGNTMPLADTAEASSTGSDFAINGNTNSFYVTYGCVGYELSISSTFETLDGNINVSFPASEYLFTNANALNELLDEGQVWDESANHYYTTYGFSPDPNYQIINPVVHYTILRREIKIDSWTQWENNQTEYNSKAQSPAVTSYTNGYDAVLEYTWSITDDDAVFTDAPKNAGNYTVWASVGHNYFLTCDNLGDNWVNETGDENNPRIGFKYTITPKKIDLTWGETDLTYTGDVQIPPAEIADGQLFAGDVCTLSVTADRESRNAGTYIATATLSNNNYTATNATKQFTINPKPVTKPTADTTVFTYNGGEQTYTIAPNADYTVVNNKRTNAGSQTVTVTLKDDKNYVWADGTVDALTFTFTIAKKQVSITWGETTFTYDGTSKLPTASLTGVVDGDTVNITITGAQTDAGTNHTATATLTGEKAGRTRRRVLTAR